MVSEFEQTVRIFYRFMDLRTLPKWLSEPHKKGNRSQVQGSTFRVKDKEGMKIRSPRYKCSFSQVIANLASNLGLGLTKLTLFS
jgi:hypothetical protein